MKLPASISRAQRREGSAVVVVMAVLALLLMYSAANLRTLNDLKAELQLLDARQVRQLERRQPPGTNAPPANAPSTETQHGPD
jgi:hypothetical protein